MSGSVKLPLSAVQWLLRGSVVAASKDDVAPVLCAVHWTIADGRVTVTATDRYRVHQLFVPAPKGTPDGEFLMSRHQAMVLLKSGHMPRSMHPGQVVVLTWTDAEPVPNGLTVDRRKPQRRYAGSIAFDVLSHDGDDPDVIGHDSAQVRGNFPPVGRLFVPEDGEGEAVDQLMLQPEFLSDTRYLRSGQGSLRFIMPRGKEGDQAHRAMPLLVVNTEGTARAMIQPFVLSMTGAKEYGA